MDSSLLPAQVKVTNDLAIVSEVAQALVYKGLDENTTVNLLNTLNEKQLRILVLVLCQMMQKFEGRK